MRISFDPKHGLYVVLRNGTESRNAIGFKVKRRSAMMFSERNGCARGLAIGPLYFGTYHRKGQPQ